MTEQEIVDLEIERKALLETASQFSRYDQCMDTEIMDLVDNLNTKAQWLSQVIASALQGQE